MKKPTLRYFARFRGASGHLRAVIRYGRTRKNVLTPLTITAGQLARLDSAGHIKQPQSDADRALNYKLGHYSTYIWQTVAPLVEAGEFDAITSAQFTNAINNRAEEGGADGEL